jgi:hypothetical protein
VVHGCDCNDGGGGVGGPQNVTFNLYLEKLIARTALITEQRKGGGDLLFFLTR